MTGYFAVQRSVDTCSISIEVRTVNNRYLEHNIRMPHYLLPYEAGIKQLIQERLSRGKVDLYVDVREREKSIELSVNEKAAARYRAMYSSLAALSGTQEEMPVSLLFNAEGVVEQRETSSAEHIWEKLQPMLIELLDGLDGLRKAEGQATFNDLRATLAIMQEDAAIIKELSKDLIPDMKLELEKRLDRMAGRDVDERLILSEAAVLASRADVHEELARLASHFLLFEEKMQLDEPVGKTLDFICQEMNREINTVGSKQSDYRISERVIMLKAHLEKIREQVRNIE
jgi:uncharacterized protein (TIGR00255 family)